MPPDPVERRLVAILSVHAVGYSRLMVADEVATARSLTAHRNTIPRSVIVGNQRAVRYVHTHPHCHEQATG